MSENQEPRRSSLNDMAQKVTKGNKVAGIIIAICMVVLGVLFIWRPLGTELITIYFAIIGFIIYGIYQIIVYVRTPSISRDGWKLANGIIFIILGVLILFLDAAAKMEMFAFLLGFLAIFGGITQISSYGAIKKSGQPGAGWVMASGIINLILGVFFLMIPFVASSILGIILGIYLIVGGIALFAEAASGHPSARA